MDKEKERAWIRAWEQRNPEKVRAAKRAWWKRNPEKVREMNHRHYWKNVEASRKYARERVGKLGPEKKAEILAYQKAYRLKKRQEVLQHYGGKCICCGESREVFLAVDHVNNDGAAHRRLLRPKGRTAGAPFYLWVIKNNYPSDLQVLCHNCNWAKSRGGCPHNEERKQNG